MADIVDEISLVNAALALFGGGAIVAFDEETDLADVCARLYALTIDEVLARNFQHLRKTRALQRIAETPENGYRYGFSFPTEIIAGPHAVYSSPRSKTVLRDYAIEGRTLFADAEAVWGVFTHRLSPDQWLPELRQAVIMALAAALVIPICEDKELSAEFSARAWGTPQQQRQGGLVAAAITADHNLASAHDGLGGSLPDGQGYGWP